MNLMDQVWQDISDAGYAKVMLWVFEENVRARSFYEKHGFVVNGKETKSFGATEVCYEYEIEKKKV